MWCVLGGMFSGYTHVRAEAAVGTWWSVTHVRAVAMQRRMACADNVEVCESCRHRPKHCMISTA